ncbi:MAG: hypothetical protein KA165_20760 [Saprospiraceae bacterium]|nr:hypothetical protein [Saprospiraceae bacterium]
MAFEKVQERIDIFATQKIKMYRLDRTAFTIQSFESATKQRAYWLSKTPAERLAAAWYLTCSAWNLDLETPPQLDRTFFAMRKHQVYATKHI